MQSFFPLKTHQRKIESLHFVSCDPAWFECMSLACSQGPDTLVWLQVIVSVDGYGGTSIFSLQRWFSRMPSSWELRRHGSPVLVMRKGILALLNMLPRDISRSCKSMSSSLLWSWVCHSRVGWWSGCRDGPGCPFPDCNWCRWPCRSWPSSSSSWAVLSAFVVVFVAPRWACSHHRHCWSFLWQNPRIGWYITNVCFTQMFTAELLVRWFVDGHLDWKIKRSFWCAWLEAETEKSEGGCRLPISLKSFFELRVFAQVSLKVKPNFDTCLSHIDTCLLPKKTSQRAHLPADQHTEAVIFGLMFGISSMQFLFSFLWSMILGLFWAGVVVGNFWLNMIETPSFWNGGNRSISGLKNCDHKVTCQMTDQETWSSWWNWNIVTESRCC